MVPSTFVESAVEGGEQCAVRGYRRSAIYIWLRFVSSLPNWLLVAWSTSTRAPSPYYSDPPVPITTFALDSSLGICFCCLSCLSHFVGDALGGFTQTPPPQVCFVCDTNLLCAHSAAYHLLSGLFSCPLEMGSNATFRVCFQPAHDQLPSDCCYLLSMILRFLFCLYF